MPRVTSTPPDFAARLRAGRAYTGLSRKAFADRVNQAGASESTLRDWERGTKIPAALVVAGLIPRLAEVTGLPAAFFWGAPNDGGDERAPAIEDVLATLRHQLDAIEDALPRTGRDIGIRDLQRLDGGGRPGESSEAEAQVREA